MAAAKFERELICERSIAGQKRYRKLYEAGKVGKEVCSRSGKNLPVGRPKRIFDRQLVAELRALGLSWRPIAAKLRIGATTARRAYKP
jgi:DNA invertase Pin-like site-specific DNA recombinase